MKDKIKPENSAGFFKWLLLVFGILTTGSLLTSIQLRLRPGPGQTFPMSFLILAVIASPLFLAAFFAVQKQKAYGRWLAFLSYSFGSCNVIWAFFWYFILYNGPKNIFTTSLVAGFDLIQFLFLGWGALTFAFPPKPTDKDKSENSHLPPPPPAFD